MIIAGPAGTIEADLISPEHADKKVVIICHPHPLYGGTMNNKVVTILARTFSELNYVVIRFNFRGIGKSTGSYDNGKGEAEDLRAVMQWAKENYPDYSVSLAGFSFGAYIAAKIATSETIALLVLVAPPVNHFDFADLTFRCPVIVIQGEKDEIVPAQAVIAWAENLSPSATLLRFPNATHFFHGQLMELKKTLKDQSLPL